MNVYAASTTYICDNGHEFGVTHWGTKPLACPRCRANYQPKRTTRRSA